jgi:hypothetical protein
MVQRLAGRKVIVDLRPAPRGHTTAVMRLAAPKAIVVPAMDEKADRISRVLKARVPKGIVDQKRVRARIATVVVTHRVRAVPSPSGNMSRAAVDRKQVLDSTVSADMSSPANDKKAHADMSSPANDKKAHEDRKVSARTANAVPSSSADMSRTIVALRPVAASTVSADMSS